MNTKEFIHIPVNLKITSTDIATILHKAFEEGGSLHWLYDIKAKYSSSLPVTEVIANDGIIQLEDIDGATYELTRGKLTMGLQQALPYLGKVINGLNLEAATIDYDGADLIIQLAVFNEIMYD